MAIMLLAIDTSALHPSTVMAIAALQGLKDRVAPENILEIGCGNGILSLTAHHIWNVPVLACDISENAVADTTANIRNHAPEGKVRALRSDGFKHPTIRRSAPYDLIIGNLLAQWHVEMAKDIQNHLKPGGIVLLSGILLWQEEGVIAALKSINIDIIQKLNKSEWQCYIGCHNPPDGL